MPNRRTLVLFVSSPGFTPRYIMKSPFFNALSKTSLYTEALWIRHIRVNPRSNIQTALPVLPD